MYEQQLVYDGNITNAQTIDLIVDNVAYDLDVKLFNDERIVGTAEISWQPELDQLTYRGGVIFYGYAKEFPAYEQDVQKQKKALEEAVEKSKQYPPRLTLS